MLSTTLDDRKLDHEDEKTITRHQKDCANHGAAGFGRNEEIASAASMSKIIPRHSIRRRHGCVAPLHLKESRTRLNDVALSGVSAAPLVLLLQEAFEKRSD